MQPVPPPDRLEEEGPDLGCLDHAYFMAEAGRLLCRWGGDVHFDIFFSITMNAMLQSKCKQAMQQHSGWLSERGMW